MGEKLVEKVDWYYVAFLGILAAATFLRFRHAFFQGMWVDEARYARLGLETSQHILSYSTIEAWRGQVTAFPPLYPYLIAFANFVFNSDLAARIVSPLVSVSGIALTYIYGREIKNREVGLIAAALLAINPIFWFLSTRILIGATFATLYTGAVFALWYGLENQKYSKYALWSLGPLVALNVMTKQPAYSLGLVIPLYFLYSKRDELKEILMEDVSFQDSKLFQTLTNRNYYISGLLGLVTIAPWMARNLFVCSFPLCGLQRAAKFAAVTEKAAWVNTSGPFNYFFSMPSIVTLPVAALLVLRIGQYLISLVNRDPDRMVKYVALNVFIVGAAFLLTPKLVPMALLTSVALYAFNDYEKLIWLWIGIGIGFMSIPLIKVPRYVVFTIPGLILIASLTVYSIASWLENLIENEKVSWQLIAVLITIPLLAISFVAASANLERGGFGKLEPAGEWMDANLPEDANIAATSSSIMRFYNAPRMAYMPPDNESEWKNFLEEKNISYVEVDVYERAAPHWIQTGIPPYRLPVATVQKLRSGELSPRQVVSSYGQVPDYLEPVKTFGKTSVPLMKKQRQPVVMVYRVNRSALQ